MWDNGGRNIKLDQGDFIGVAPTKEDLHLLLQLRELERALSVCLFVCLVG